MACFPFIFRHFLRFYTLRVVNYPVKSTLYHFDSKMDGTFLLFRIISRFMGRQDLKGHPMGEKKTKTQNLGGRAARWTDAEREILAQMRAENKTSDEIAAKLGRTKAAVSVKASRRGLSSRRAPAKDGSKYPMRRPCMCCTNEFLSEGIGHRICSECKDGDIWSSGSNYIYEYGGGI